MKRLNGLGFVAMVFATFFAVAAQADATSVCRPAAKHSSALRRHTGIPSIATSPKNGRLWVTFYGGVTPGEDSTSYVPLMTSIDGGNSWKTVLVAEPELGRRVFDPELWVSPDGRLRWTLTSRACRINTNDLPIPYGGDSGDPKTDRLMMAVLDAENEPVELPTFRQIADGVMMCKPIVLRDGTWLLPVSHWYAEPSACFFASTDGGMSYVFRGGASIHPKENRRFDEHSVVELKNGDLLSFIRAKGESKYAACLESTSHDGGKTWSATTKARFEHTSSRHALIKLKSGNLLLVKNGPLDKDVGRSKMTAFLSKDDGATWHGGLVLDERNQVSYPDADQAANGLIYVTYDHKRMFSQEILVAGFTEDEVLSGKASGRESFLKRRVVSIAGDETAAVDIDNGRQLFVDNHLVAMTRELNRRWNKPVKELKPVILPALAGKGVHDGGVDANLTCATDGGLWWDPTKRRYRLWYQADWCGDICYAESVDGRKWEYPDLGIVKGTNRIFKKNIIDSWAVVPNYAAKNPYADWKMHISLPGGKPTDDQIYESTDGIHFKSLGVAGISNDRSTMYYDPFRGEWVFSLRCGWPMRCRRRFASRTFGGEGCHWRWPGEKETNEALPLAEMWLMATNKPNWQLYSFNAVAYESLMLGVKEILYNTPHDNGDCAKVGLPKQTGLHFCFSRDGKTFEHREEVDIEPCGWGSGKWDTGYLSTIGGICTVNDNEITFYYSGLKGDVDYSTKAKPGIDGLKNGMYRNGAIGRAVLRRDGFVGLVAEGRGELVTRPLKFTGGHLFVNAECNFGSVAAEMLDEDGIPIAGYTIADCEAMAQEDATKRELKFKGGDISALGKRGARVRFKLKCATLYSFWVSPTARGESRGYVAAGGPDYPGLRDE